MKKVSAEGVDFIKRWEGLSLEAYQDGGGVWTIGYGHTAGVQKDDRITESDAEDFLLDDISWAEKAINKLVNTNLSQKQFDAIVSFVYNLGTTNFKASTLLRRLNSGDFLEVPEQICRWNHDGSNMVLGLSRRRVAEAQRFLDGML